MSYPQPGADSFSSFPDSYLRITGPLKQSCAQANSESGLNRGPHFTFVRTDHRNIAAASEERQRQCLQTIEPCGTVSHNMVVNLSRLKRANLAPGANRLKVLV